MKGWSGFSLANSVVPPVRSMSQKQGIMSTIGRLELFMSFLARSCRCPFDERKSANTLFIIKPVFFSKRS